MIWVDLVCVREMQRETKRVRGDEQRERITPFFLKKKNGSNLSCLSTGFGLHFETRIVQAQVNGHVYIYVDIYIYINITFYRTILV